MLNGGKETGEMLGKSYIWEEKKKKEFNDYFCLQNTWDAAGK